MSRFRKKKNIHKLDKSNKYRNLKYPIDSAICKIPPILHTSLNWCCKYTHSRRILRNNCLIIESREDIEALLDDMQNQFINLVCPKCK